MLRDPGGHPGRQQSSPVRDATSQIPGLVGPFEPVNPLPFTATPPKYLPACPPTLKLSLSQTGQYYSSNVLL